MSSLNGFRALPGLSCLLTLAVLAAVIPESASAQRRPYFRERALTPAEKGDRLRVVRSGIRPAQLFGELLAIDSRSILVDTSSLGDTVRVALADIESIERYAGIATRTSYGAGIGALAGVGIGVVYGAIAVAEADPHWDYLAVMAGIYVGAGLAVVGAVIGGIAGSNIRYHRWEPVTTEYVEFSRRAFPGMHDDARHPPGVALAIRFEF